MKPRGGQDGGQPDSAGVAAAGERALAGQGGTWASAEAASLPGGADQRGHGEGDAFPTRLATIALVAPAADRLRSLLDLNLVDDEDVAGRSGYGALIASLREPPLRVWPQQPAGNQGVRRRRAAVPRGAEAPR